MPHIGFNSLHMFEASACTNVPRGSGCEQLFEAIRKRLFHNTRYAILGGGGVYGVMYIGALMELCGYSRTQYAAWASKLRGVAGTSVGSVIGIMLAAGLDPWDMRSIVRQSGLARVMDSVLDIPLEEMQKRCAVGSGARVDDVARDLVRTVTGNPETTFEQFYAKTRREFVVTVTNGKSSTAEFWSYKNKPDMPLWQAIRCSTSVPGIFPPYDIDGVLFFDGGVTCNLPCHLYTPAQTLSLFTHGAFKQPSYTKITDMMLHGLQMYMSAAQLGPMRMSCKLAARGIPCVTHQSNTGILGPFAFDATPAMFDDLIVDGARCVRGVMFRDVLLVCCLVWRMWPYIPMMPIKIQK